MTDYLYGNMLVKLKNMDEKQLIELFHDIDDIERVEMIIDCANYYVENYVTPQNGCIGNNEQYEDDCRQRAQDMQSEIKRNY